MSRRPTKKYPLTSRPHLYWEVFQPCYAARRANRLIHMAIPLRQRPQQHNHTHGALQSSCTLPNQPQQSHDAMIADPQAVKLHDATARTCTIPHVAALHATCNTCRSQQHANRRSSVSAFQHPAAEHQPKNTHCLQTIFKPRESGIDGD